MESIRYEEILYFVIVSMNWIFWGDEKTNDIGENVWLIRSMIIIQKLVYDEGKALKVILMWINLGIMIGFYWEYYEIVGSSRSHIDVSCGSKVSYKLKV